MEIFLHGGAHQPLCSGIDDSIEIPASPDHGR